MADDYPLRNTAAENQVKKFAAQAVRDLTGKSNSEIYQLADRPGIFSFATRSTEALRSASTPRQYQPIEVTHTEFPSSPVYASNASSSGSNGGSGDAVAPGITANITVCVDNGDSTFTQKIAQFVNGILVGLA